MNWAFKRQMMYASVVIGTIVIILGSLFAYIKITSQPTCFDGEKNQDERGVDCGGSCELVCREDTRGIVTLWSQVAPVTDSFFNAVGYIENQNVAAGMQDVPYRFRVYDERNIFITEVVGNTYIGPNERTALFVPSLDVGNRIPSIVFLDLPNNPVWEKTEERFAKKLVTVETSELLEFEGSTKLVANLRNENIFPLSEIDVVGIVYDAQGNVLGASQTYLEKMEPGTAAIVSFTWPSDITPRAVRTDVIPRVNPYTQ